MRMLLKGARIIDPSQGLDGPGDILIDRDTIAALGEEISADGCEVVDCRGLTAAPG